MSLELKSRAYDSLKIGKLMEHNRKVQCEIGLRGFERSCNVGLQLPHYAEVSHFPIPFRIAIRDCNQLSNYALVHD